MTSKAELETELKRLRARNAELESKTEQATETNAKKQDGSADDIHKLLAERGIDLSKVENVGEALVEEIGRLQKDYPITVILAAFALGYAVGRAQR
ncbi:hypothetical protein [Ruegeria arenilitoris]|uniref:hypothetical protein n=1 Tax=Ruegeria arenilitoris TaxID=1173585 RepID=UPI0014814B01|nr:hypothetical protein [Ruegeria arenilitoris]